MLPQQKEASYTLGISVFFMLVQLIIIPLFTFFRSEAILISFILFIVCLWITRRALGFRFKILDEMDKTIRYQAALVAIHVLGAVVSIYAVALYLLHQNPMLVPVHQVLQMAVYSWLSLYISWSGSILILYKRGAFYV